MSRTQASDPPARSLPQLLFEIGKLIGSVDDLGALLGRISELVTEMVGADACSIMLLDSERGLLLGKAAYGHSRANIGKVSFRLGEEGYANAEIEPVPELVYDKKEVAVTFFVNPQSRVYVRRINFKGVDQIDDALVTGQDNPLLLASNLDNGLVGEVPLPGRVETNEPQVPRE